MPRLVAFRTNSSFSTSAALRERTGLTQEELGLWLGVSGGQVAHVEAGRRGYSAKAQARLHLLAALLPRPLPPTPPAPAPAGPNPGEQAALRARLRQCRHQLAGLEYDEHPQAVVSGAVQRRTQAQAALRTALAAQAAPAGNPDAETTRLAAWLETVELATQLAAKRALSPTGRRWLELRQRLLREEIAGLEALLDGGGGSTSPP